ncbi:IS66 family insertion sequence element accessory protein TnpA [Castellaniella sp. S9]|uniref:IS66 family insertion sequence element accessory protein TnpA n=1 Tax=Castellaniella sp. S9 TaxID=2993652 RepID=UPI0022B39A92|nr:cobyrinic acid ac-diamide synthase [Castellaniella sp. S9]
MTDTKDWAAHLAAIEAEGISTQAYARREGISAATLYYWRRRLKPAVQRSPTVSLVPVQVKEETVAQRCTVWLAPGVRLELGALPPAWWLSAVTAAVSRQVR